MRIGKATSRKENLYVGEITMAWWLEEIYGGRESRKIGLYITSRIRESEY
jgi:hypothetical protein